MRRARPPRALLAVWSALLAVGVTRVAHAQDASDAEGFADAAPAQISTPSTEPASEAPPALQLTGTVAVQSALRLARSGLDRFGKGRLVFAPRLEYRHDIAGSSSLQVVASGRAEADFAYLLRPDAYDAPTMERYSAQLIPGQSYLSVSGAHFELALGEQIVNLGQSEVLTLLDAVNPRDLREPLFADLDELRLPLLMTRVGLSFARFAAQLLVVHEPYFGLLPPPLGEFSPLRKYLREQPLIGAVLDRYELRFRHRPGRSPAQLDALQPHARLSLRLPRADLSVQGAWLLDAQGVPVFPSAAQLRATRIDLELDHRRYTLLGQAGAVTVGAFLLRWELAAELARSQVVRVRDKPVLSSERLHTLRALLGVTYVPTARTNVALEALFSHVIDSPARRPDAQRALLFPVEAPQFALRFSQLFLRDRLALTLVVLSVGLRYFNGLAARAEVAFTVTDALRLALGGVHYQPSASFGPFYGFERNDRAYLNVRWSFAAN